MAFSEKINLLFAAIELFYYAYFLYDIYTLSKKFVIYEKQIELLKISFQSTFLKNCE